MAYPYRACTDTEYRASSAISKSADGARNRRALCFVKTLLAEIPLLRANGQETKTLSC